MRVIRLILMWLPLALGGCLSFSSSNPRPPANNTTIVVPPGSTVVCSNGAVRHVNSRRPNCHWGCQRSGHALYQAGTHQVYSEPPVTMTWSLHS